MAVPPEMGFERPIRDESCAGWRAEPAGAAGNPSPMDARVCRLLLEDPELCEAIPQARRAEAIARCTASELTIPRGRASEAAPRQTLGGIGVLVLDGFVLQRMLVNAGCGTELLGAGDLLGELRPDGELPALESAFEVLAPLRVAVLDAAFAERELARYPELGVALVARARRRSANLAVRMAIINRPLVEDRVWLLLWHLAGRWGRVRTGEVLLPLRLTHALLSELVAARRPTVSGALSDLARRGLVRRSGEGWALSRQSVGDLVDLGVLDTGNGSCHTYQGSDRR